MSSLATTLRRAAYAAPLVFAAAAANVNAQGLNSGCAPKEAINAVLMKEGQFIIAQGNRVTDDRNINVFTSNNDMTLGYNLEGDAKTLKDSKTICMRTMYDGINLNDAGNKAAPAWWNNISANKGIDPQKAYVNGARAVLVARSFTKAADGSRIPGKYIVLHGNVKDDFGAVWGVTPNGVPDSAFAMVSFATTQHFTRMLGAQSVASERK